jgi:DNA replication and repair protein RecF
MLIRQLTLSQFRNVRLATLAFAGTRQFFAGANGQGKSNLLEAAGCLTALRSFRTPDSRHLIMHDCAEAGIACDVEREDSGTERVVIKIRRDGKELWYGDKKVSRLADHVGRFPTVVFSSHDLQLIRGAPALRRRWLDLTLAAMDAEYLGALQDYARALAGRNSLLRRHELSPAKELAAFDRTLAPAGAKIVALRALRVAELGSEMAAAYRRLTGSAEEATLHYDSSLIGLDGEGIRALLEAGRARDLQAGSTSVGPHRDDLGFRVSGVDAGDFASEGQQRSVTLALRLAQAAWFQRCSRVRPVLLADDVLGELDPERRERFWGALDQESQVIATGTSLPEGERDGWQVFTVAGGLFAPGTPGRGSTP